jgi:hypothetical protein
MSFLRTRTLSRRDGGQAAVEMALVTPLMVFFILGILQLTLMHQAKLMLEYAAFTAARAGAVWNGDPKQMEKAAVFALLPTMPMFPVPSGTPLLGKPQAVDTLPKLGIAYTSIYVANSFMPDNLKLIKVTTLNPTKNKFPAGQKEIEFDTEANRKNTQLVIRVNYLYELRIPFANRILWESWFAANAGVKLVGLDPSQPKVRIAGPVEIPMEYKMRVLLEAGKQKTGNCAMTGVTKTQLYILAALASGIAGGGGRFYIPLMTTHTIRMQSNPFKKFAGPNKGGCG